MGHTEKAHNCARANKKTSRLSRLNAASAHAAAFLVALARALARALAALAHALAAVAIAARALVPFAVGALELILGCYRPATTSSPGFATAALSRESGTSSPPK